jgi:predicted Zn-dependent protease
LGPDDLAKAQDLLNRGHPDQAIVILKTLAAVEPPVRGVEHELGTAYYSIGELEAAKDAFAKAIKQDASDRDSVQMEGLILYRLGQPDAAIPYLERVVQRTANPNAEAQMALTKAITLDTNLTSAFLKMGMVLLRGQDVQTVIMYLEHGEKSAPNDFETHSILAQAYHRIGQEDDAKRENAIADKVHQDSQILLQTGK